MVAPSHASPVDVARYGEYRFQQEPGDPRPLLRFTGRITADGAGGYPAQPGRYHLYASWFCPWAQRLTITHALAGLAGVVGVSYVDNRRDGRGWAFREATGADPVNGFTLLREAYQATDPGYDGHVSVPVLWDRQAGRIVSNAEDGLDVDLASQFGRWAAPVVDLWPAPLRAEIDALDRWLGPAVNHGAGAATGDGPQAPAARAALLAALDELDQRLAGRDHLVGGQLTLADVRLWVTLVRFDVGANADRGLVAAGLAAYPHLDRYVQRLHRLPAFRDTTDPAAFTRAGATVPTWLAG